MILIELHTEELPSVREVPAPHFLRLSVVEAFRAGDPIPVSIAEAIAYLNEYHPSLWAFQDAEAADLWAASYEGFAAETVRDALRYFVNGYQPLQREVANG
jgi:hypothetical protein